MYVIKSFEVLKAHIAQEILSFILLEGLRKESFQFVKSDVAFNVATDNKNVLSFIYSLNI